MFRCLVCILTNLPVLYIDDLRVVHEASSASTFKAHFQCDSARNVIEVL